MMLDVLTGEFFWGVVIGLILSILGGYALAIFQAKATAKAQKLIFRDFSIDTVKNLKQIIDDMNDVKNRSGNIYYDYLILMEVEIGVFGRNREHLNRIPEPSRSDLRKLINSIAIKRAEAANYLGEFYKKNELANQLLSQGQGPHSQRVRGEGTPFLDMANKAVDQMVSISQSSAALIKDLEAVR